MFALHDDIEGAVFQAGITQFLNVTFHKLHIGFAVSEQLCVMLYIPSGHIKLKEGEHDTLTHQGLHKTFNIWHTTYAGTFSWKKISII